MLLIDPLAAASVATQCLMFADITPPVVTLSPPVFQFLQAGTAWVDPGATATDTRDGVVPIVRFPTTPNNLLLAVQSVSSGRPSCQRFCCCSMLEIVCSACLHRWAVQN
jgi:hypothetical protein